MSLYTALPGALLPWYEKNKRDLPWRTDKNPYHVWLSEIMLQQTRVEAVRAYYLHFLEVFPTVYDLASAQEDALLKCWEGLGYYSRARNLRKTAIRIVADYGGQFPADYASLLALPGIGPYTAGAIASICFEMPTPAVDGNVLRVIARIMKLQAPIDTYKKEITDALAAVYPIGQCGAFTQSLMELGATVCTPDKSPSCTLCPANTFCRGYADGIAAKLPIRAPKRPRRVEDRTVFVLSAGGKIAVLKRSLRGLLAGMWEFPNVPSQLSAADAVETARQWGVKPIQLEKSVVRTHIFTHVEWHMTCYYIHCAALPPAFTWVSRAALQNEVALPTAFRIFA